MIPKIATMRPEVPKAQDVQERRILTLFYLLRLLSLKHWKNKKIFKINEHETCKKILGYLSGKFCMLLPDFDRRMDCDSGMSEVIDKRKRKKAFLVDTFF